MMINNMNEFMAAWTQGEQAERAVMQTELDRLRAENARLREALVIAVDYAVELLGERNWQNGTIERYQTEYDELKAFIEMTRKALANETPTA